MASSTEEFIVDRLLERLRGSLLEIEQRYRKRGRSVTELGLEQLADRMASVVPVPSPVNEATGPFYRLEQVARLFGVSRQAVHERARKGSLLALRTADGRWVFPVFQFDGRRLREGFSKVLAAFGLEAVEPWAVAAWWVSPSGAFEGATPLEALDRGDLRALVSAARDARRRWIE